MQDMASEERKAADNKIKEENLFKALGAEEVQAETDAFQCGRCKQVRVVPSLPWPRLLMCGYRGSVATDKHRHGVLMSR